MHADNRRSLENGGCECSPAGRFSGLGRCVAAAVKWRKGSAEEGLAAEASQQWASQREQFRLASQQSVVLVEELAESVAGVKDDGFSRKTGAGSRAEAFGEAGAHGGQQIAGRKLRLRAPLFRTASGVHKYHASAELRAYGRDCRVPSKAAYIVDDFRTGGECCLGCLGLISVNGNDGAGMSAQYAFEDRQQPCLFFFGADCRCLS